MADENTAKIPLTIQLSAELAARLKLAAERQRRPPADVVAELLERHLPRTSPKSGNIPYA